MPPRNAKRGPGASGGKKTPAKTPTKSPKSAAKAEAAAASVAVAEQQQSQKEKEQNMEAVKVQRQQQQQQQDVLPVKEDRVPLKPSNGSGAVKQEPEEDTKAVYEEDDKGERLELDDNEPESEPEEDEPEHDPMNDEEMIDEQNEEEGVDDRYEDVEEEDEEEGVGDDVDEEEEEEEDEGGHHLEEDDVDDEPDNEEEEEEQHLVVKERRKRKEFEVFVGGLDKDATEDDLKRVFSEVGEVVEIRLMRNPQTHKNKGFAFIRFGTVEAAKRACTELKNPQVRGKVCGVSASQDSDTIFVGNICKTWTKEALKDKLKYYGVESIQDLTLVEDPKVEGMNRGFAFLEFSNRTDAMNSYKRLQKRDVVLGTDRTAKVSFAETFVEPDEEVMAQVRTIFIDGMPPSWDEDRVKESLKKHKEIEKVQLARNMPSARRRDFGFVTFSTHDAAVACIEDVNANGLPDGDNKVKVKARLSKPHQKGRLLKQGVRGGYVIGRGGRGSRVPWSRYPSHFEARRFAGRGGRFLGRGAAFAARGMRRPSLRSPLPPPPERVPGRHLPPVERVRDRRPPPPVYARSSSRRDYGRREDPYDDRPVRSSRSSGDYSPRGPPMRRSSYRDSYPSRGSAYTDPAPPPRGVSRPSSRRPSYPEESFSRGVEKSYREGRGRDYDTVSGSKRPYSAMDRSPRYDDAALRHSRARLDYGVGGGASQYGDYGESRLGRGSQMGYGSSRQESSYGLYDGRQSGMGYGGGSMGGEAGGVYSSYSSDYLSSGADIGGSSYSSMYSSRGVGGYMPGGGSGSYY